MLHVLEPVPDAPSGRTASLAGRLSSLKGTTLLLLDNTKPNASEILKRAAGLLVSEYGVAEVVSVTKQPNFSKGVTHEELGENIGKAHLALTALGD